tara:strand:+ start:569 stop:3451 length:2883 start_codon:yes stop_codon:yes gene_type:complete
MNISDYYDQIYIIHLDDLLDRKESIIKQIEHFKLKKVTIIDAINKNKMDREKLKEKELIGYAGNKYCKNKIINKKGLKCWCNGGGHEDVCRYTGRLACAYSHYLAYKDMYDNKYERCLILEDDFITNRNLDLLFTRYCDDIPEDWDIIYYCNSLRGRFLGVSYNNSFYYLRMGLQDAGGYAITKEVCSILYENFFPIRAAADGYITKMVEIFEKKNIYVSKQDLFFNGSINRFKSVNDNYKIMENDENKKKELNEKIKKLVNEYNKINIESIYNNKVNMENVKKKVISFCLYGGKAMYIIGMKENILLAKEFFPDWVVHIYYNETVPEKHIKEFESLDAKCVLCENVGINKLNWEGMFWRWFPLDEEDVEIWLSRDADSRLSKREAEIVNEWIESGKTLHTIRDHRCHIHCIMGGMFGINNKLFNEKYKFKKVKDIIKELSVYYRDRPYNVDQIFLNDNLWELLKNDQFAHISNGGRRVYETDKEIPSAGNFIGKQHRIDDFYENKLKYMDGKKGCYWKKSTSADVYYSKSSVNIRRDVKFNSEGEYYKHRAENGFPQNWDNIQVMDGVVIQDSEEVKPSKPDKGVYWKSRTGKGEIYWSNSSINVRSDVKFKNPDEFFKHRRSNNYPSNWSYIETLNGEVTSDELPEPPKRKEITREKDKGFYWKNNGSAAIFWSNSSINVKANIRFNNPNEFFAHRKQNGYPANWSGIETMQEKISEEVVNEEEPLVSIAISTYEANGKGENFLQHSFEKIMEQTYKNIEIVVSDHSSDDKIKKVCEEYNNKKYPIKYVHNEKEKGNSSQNTNNAIENCSGTYIKVLFMDDYINNEEAISMIVSEFEKNPEKKWLVHSYKHTKNYTDFYNLHHPKIVSDMIFCNRIGCPSCLTIHSSVKERFDEKLKWFMDSELYSRILKLHGQPIFLHTKEETKPLMINLHHEDQVTNTKIDGNLVNKEKEYIRQKK